MSAPGFDKGSGRGRIFSFFRGQEEKMKKFLELPAASELFHLQKDGGIFIVFSL
jgi:hypothetical protein